MSVEYLEGVITRRYWCPEAQTARIQPVASPPLAAIIKGQVDDALRIQGKKPLGRPTYMPNRDWLLICLGTLTPGHPVFHKDYLPDPR